MVSENKDKPVDIRECIYELLKDQGKIQTSDVVNKSGKNRQAVSRELNNMGKQGLLEKTFSDKGHTAWQLPGKSTRWRGVRLSDLEHEGILRTIDYISKYHASPLEIQKSLEISPDAVTKCLRTLNGLHVTEVHSEHNYYDRYQLTEDGKRLHKLIQQIEQV